MHSPYGPIALAYSHAKMTNELSDVLLIYFYHDVPNLKKVIVNLNNLSH